MSLTDPEPRPTGFWERLRELDRFFQGRDAVHKTMRRAAARLERAGIPYAVVGGMAVKLHAHLQATDDVDILLTADGLEEFRRRYVPKHYAGVPYRPRRFVDRTHQVRLDVLLTGRLLGRNGAGPVGYPDPAAVAVTIENIRVVDFVTLIQIKLARGRYKDFGDVASLIACHNLDESFADRLHPSVRPSYMECLSEKRREDEFQANYG